MTLQILLIEHQAADGLYPFTSTHCSWEVRTGAFTILERWVQAVPQAHVTVHSHREAHLASFLERYPHIAPFRQAPTLIVSGHVLASPSVMRQLTDTCAASDQPIILFCGGNAVGAFLPNGAADPRDARVQLDAMDVDQCRTIEISGHLLNRLWQALDHIDASIGWDAALIGTHVHPTATIHPSAVIDESHGPVLILEGAHVGAHTVLTGPVVVGERSTVKPFTSLEHTVLGPVCKAAGEVTSTILQGYANKQHDGFVGHSYLNEWTNLGAGTVTSNLKNTYGHIQAHLPWGVEDTQRMFVGLLMGAHSKSGIGTRFTTGTVCGISSNAVYESITPSAIPSFWWAPADQPYQIDKAIAVARTVMARRMVDLGPATEALLRHESGAS